MQTEFTCGIYTATLDGLLWSLQIVPRTVGIIGVDGETLQFQCNVIICPHDLVEIAVLMNNIKRQYKQLQTT